MDTENTQLDDFTKAEHTVILSDIHLADAEPPHPGNPLWKRFKRPKFFIDRSFKRFLEQVQGEASGNIELILNGDIFDFDSVMVIPENPPFKVSWLERKRGLVAEEQKSRFKMSVILKDHYVWVEALRDFILKGNRLIFIIGNHDMELHWPGVQEEVLAHLDLPEEHRNSVRFCAWFYISNKDTLIEHGNQYDDYCICSNPINPLIKKSSHIHVRLPFGNLAGKYILNGIGLMNPHVDSTFIKSTLYEYLVFFYRDVMRVQPLLMWTWLWGALVTMVKSIREGLLPALRDPLTVESRVEEIAAHSNANPALVRSLRALHVHPAIFHPYRILRELWLDRFLLLVFLFLFCFWFFSTLNVFLNVSVWWFIIPVLITLPLFVFYARSVETEMNKVHRELQKRVPISGQMAKVNRVVHGHTHHEMHTQVEGVELLNTGTWSPAFRDPECTQAFGRKCFAWIKPEKPGKTGRTAELFAWEDPGYTKIQFTKDSSKISK